jgi:UDP-N-acetylmuramoyl-tripeptide--D-alanyl-D-alanine ligase
MEARSLRFVAAACAGEQLSGSPETRVLRVCADSRSAQAGDLFFALLGGRFYGHDFFRQATKKWARAVVVERKRVLGGWSGCAMIVVEDKC